jgi:hypothetical protein
MLKEEIKLQMIKEYLDKNPQIKTVVYIVLGVVGLNVTGKIFSV